MEALEKETTQWIERTNFENRRYPRFDIRLPVEYYQIKSSMTHTGNISESGLLVYFPKGMDISQFLKLKLFFPLGHELSTIKLLGEAVWMDCNLIKDQECYPYGIKFVDIPPEDRNKLRHFLRSLSSPLDHMPRLFNALKIRFWIRKFLNPPREYIPRIPRLEILSLLTRFDENRETKKPVPLRDRQFEKENIQDLS